MHSTLCFRSSRALLCACGVRTGVWYLYSHALVYCLRWYSSMKCILAACSCFRGVRTNSMWYLLAPAPVSKKECSGALTCMWCLLVQRHDGIYTRSVLVWLSLSGGATTNEGMRTAMHANTIYFVSRCQHVLVGEAIKTGPTRPQIGGTENITQASDRA